MKRAPNAAHRLAVRSPPWEAAKAVRLQVVGPGLYVSLAGRLGILLAVPRDSSIVRAP